MCIRDRPPKWSPPDSALDISCQSPEHDPFFLSCLLLQYSCLLYTSDAADDLLCVDLGGRRIIKKKKLKKSNHNLLKNLLWNDYTPKTQDTTV